MSAEQGEAGRILREYARRARELPRDKYALTRPSELFRYQERTRVLLEVLAGSSLPPLTELRILEVGCGRGDWLLDFERFGVPRASLCGIELSEARGAEAAERLGPQGDAPGADIRVGDASALPWGDARFDVVLQSTVFTSILDASMKRAVAAEMRRVLRPGGCVLWYDFRYDNPANAAVRGVGRGEIAALFPGFSIELRRVTLAPPLARRLVPITWLGAAILERLEVLNSHYLGLLQKPGAP